MAILFQNQLPESLGTALKASCTASSGPVSVASFPCKPKGRSLKLCVDKDVQEYVRQLGD